MSMENKGEGMIHGKELVISSIIPFQSTHMQILITLVWFDFFMDSLFTLQYMKYKYAQSFILPLSSTKAL